MMCVLSLGTFCNWDHLLIPISKGVLLGDSVLWVVVPPFELVSFPTYYNNLILGMAAACRWSVEWGKLRYPSTFGHVPNCVYMSYRVGGRYGSLADSDHGGFFFWATEQMSCSFPSSRGSSMCSWYTAGRKKRDKNLLTMFYVKIGKVLVKH
jgi:hypothetical protein